MTPDTTLDPIEQPANQAPSTAGMTTRVVKGSLWTLAGQVVPLIATFLSTPFVIRFLGTESYGVIILVSLFPYYFAFGDLGMGLASTKFGSEAYAKGKKVDEGKAVRTASLISLISLLTIIIPVAILSPLIIENVVNVPLHLQDDAVIALRISCGAFVLGTLSNVVNTPQLSRLRMDLNSSINAAGKMILAVATPVALYFHSNVIVAASVGLSVAGLVFFAHVLVSGRLLPELFGTTISRTLVTPMVTFGLGLLASTVGLTLLGTMEKLMASLLVDVKSLAYYSVAFTFANMATLFASSMIQSLVPAYSQLLSPEKESQLRFLYAQSIKLNVIGILPLAMFLFVIGKPFLSTWAGEEFGANGSLPFYILLVGLLFNVVAYVPYALIIAKGATNVLAKIYWVELAFYVILVYFMVRSFGIVGAAISWSVRAAIDAIILILTAGKISNVAVGLGSYKKVLGASIAILAVPVVVTVLIGGLSIIVVTVSVLSLCLYAIATWKYFLTAEECRRLIGLVRT